MTKQNPTMYQDVDGCVDQIIAKVGKEIVFGVPLGLGKPPHLINALYNRAKQDPSISLKIITAISLEKPSGKSELEKRFLTPFAERVFGGVPDLEYALDQRVNKLPANVTVTEFYFRPASFLKHTNAQQNYICTNYTHASRDLIDFGINVMAQTISKREVNGKVSYSLACNPDIFLDLLPMMHEAESQGRKIAVVGQVNREMPFMMGDAQSDGSEFDAIIDNPDYDYRLFSSPNMSVAATDHAIGFNASTLLKDGGTLQIGIGSLGDALINSTLMRHQHNSDYREMVKDLNLQDKSPLIDKLGGLEPFEKGLYGNTEMFVHGYMDLYKAGILKRKVYDHLVIQELINQDKLNETVTPDALSVLVEHGVIRSQLDEIDVALLCKYGFFKAEVSLQDGKLQINDQSMGNDLSDAEQLADIVKHCLGDKLKGGVVLHGAFFLGPQDFYQSLRDLTEEQRQEMNMTAVSYTNGLFGQMKLKSAQRQHARYINTCMKMTLMGAAASDGLECGQVVSGVGGQYNFVAMAHEQPQARSILLLKSTHSSGKGVESNIVFKYGHTTIPRHLRDIVVTEYGIADLRGKSDNEVIKQLIQLADSRFQAQLVAEAKSAGKLAKDYEVPAQFRNNTPARIAHVIGKYQRRGCFKAFPFSCDFTDEELAVGKALKGLKAKTANKGSLVKTLAKALFNPVDAKACQPQLVRMGLNKPANLKQKLLQRLLLTELTPMQNATPDKPVAIPKGRKVPTA